MRHSPEIRSVPIDKIAPLGVPRDAVPAAEHGSQHGVVIPLQGGQASGEVRTPNIQRDDLWKL